MVEMGYHTGMTNNQALSPESASPAETMRERGHRLRSILREQRWSNREAARTLGLNHTYVGSRVNGEVDLTVADIQAFAGILGLEPDALLVKLLGHDSNVEPIGSRLALVSQISSRKAHPSSVQHGKSAVVTPLRNHG
jgi:transcriptional regulator with XRE-family HTH domain